MVKNVLLLICTLRSKYIEMSFQVVDCSIEVVWFVVKAFKYSIDFVSDFTDDFNRVILKRKPGEENSDYINASYIDVSAT